MILPAQSERPALLDAVQLNAELEAHAKSLEKLNAAMVRERVVLVTAMRSVCAKLESYADFPPCIDAIDILARALRAIGE